MSNPILLLDIDGLRPDDFQTALQTGQLPHLSRLLGGADMARGLLIPALAPAPSITFCSQASLFTGAHPKNHGIPGNQFFDRFGTYNNGQPLHFAFDVGDQLAVDDAVRVFLDGLASQRLMANTVYERLSGQGKTSVVAGNMYARGATTWLKPSLINLARFTKGGNLFGMEAHAYDRHILDQVVRYLGKNGMPDLLTVYLMGLDHISHKYGPGAQLEYLVTQIDPLVGELLQAITKTNGAKALPDNLLSVIFSDHGQIKVIPDDMHSLRIGFPFDKEMGHLFTALGLDVHDYPGEEPNCDAVMALNGGLAYVYLQNKTGHWADPPDFERDVLPVARAFWDAHLYGHPAPELKRALGGVLLRNVQAKGWTAPYEALTPDGQILPLDVWFLSQPDGLYLDPVNRLDNLSGLYSGDLILISNYQDGYYFGGPITGVHGGLHPADSRALLVYGCPGADEDSWQQTRGAIINAIEKRCLAENNRKPSITDMLTGLYAVL